MLSSQEVFTRRLNRRVLLAQVVALPLSVGLGLWVCGTDLGWSDSLVLARPGTGSAVSFVTLWYTRLNGRLCQAIITYLARLPFSFSATPESFPFWLFAGFSFYCTLMTPLLIGACLARAARSTPAGAVLGLLIVAVWSTNPVLFENVTYHHFAIFMAYVLPTYLSALWFRHAMELARGDVSRSALVLHGLSYLFLSNYLEVLLFSLPVLGLLAWGLSQPDRRRPARTWALLVSAYLALSAVAATVYWLSPGQQRRAVSLGATLPPLSALPVDRLLQIVPTGYFGLDSRWAPLAYGVGMLGYAVWLTILGIRSRVHHSSVSWRSRNGFVVVGAVLFLAHGAAMLPLLAVNLPPRVAIHPGLLLVTSLALLLLGVIWPQTAISAAGEGGTAIETTVGTQARPAGRSGMWRALILAAAASLACAVAVVQLMECASVQRERQRLFALRERLYQYILALHDHSGVSAFVLTSCDLAPGGEAIEPAWGLQAYFAWARPTPVKVFIDSNDDYPGRPIDREYAVLSCRDFLRTAERSE